MDEKSITSVLQKFKDLEMYPYFHIIDSLLTSLMVRKQLGTKEFLISRKQPLALWLLTILKIKAGTLITHFLLGLPILDPFKNTHALLINTICWYALFYSPLDIIYRICTIIPINIMMCTFDEVYRLHRISNGIKYVGKVYPNSWIIKIFVGTIRGNSGALIAFTQMLVRGDWKLNLNSFKIPYVTKASFMASATLVMAQQFKTDIFIYFCISLFFIYNKVTFLLLRKHNPFLAVEKFIAKIFFGGMWDPWNKNCHQQHEEQKDQ